MIVYIVGAIAALICWVMAIVKASQGSAFKFPFIGNIADPAKHHIAGCRAVT
jgi:uncharacterized membrane protein